MCTLACEAIIGCIPKIIHIKQTCSGWAIEMAQWVEELAPVLMA